MFHGLYTVIWYRWSRASAYTPLQRFIHAAIRLRVIETRDAEIRLCVCHCQPARLRRRAMQGEPCATHGQPLAPRPSPSPNTPCKRAAVRASDAASARGGSTISAASVDISCSACALLERRHVASSGAPPQQNILIIIRCAHPLCIPFKRTAPGIFFLYLQA